MKSLIISAIILVIIFSGCFYVSKSQNDTLAPVCQAIDSLLRNAEDNPSMHLEECINALKEKRFVIELGLPGDDFDKVYYLLKSAKRFSEANDKSLFYEKLEECKIYLESLIEYSKVNLASIL